MHKYEHTYSLEKQKAVHWRAQDVMEKLSKEDKATDLLCNLRQIGQLLWASFPPMVKGRVWIRIAIFKFTRTIPGKPQGFPGAPIRAAGDGRMGAPVG